jgi:hypothetical protein
VSVTRDLGFVDAQPLTRFRGFEGTSAEHKVSHDLRAHGLNFFARKPLSSEYRARRSALHRHRWRGRCANCAKRADGSAD